MPPSQSPVPSTPTPSDIPVTPPSSSATDKTVPTLPKKKRATTAPTVAEVRPLKSGVRTNLLRSVDVKRDAVADEPWKIEGSALVQEPGSKGYNRIQFPIKPPAEYELRVTAVSLSPGRTELVVGLVVGSSQAGFVANQDTKICGLESISEKAYDGPNETTRSDLFDWPPDQALQIVCRVTPSHVQVFVNGKNAVDWKGDSSTLHGYGNRGAPDKSKLYLGARMTRGTSGGSYRFTAIDVLPLSVRAQPVPPSDDVAATSEKVKQLIGELPATAGAGWKVLAAGRLHDQAATADDEALRYALLAEAIKLAGSADDVNLVNYLLEDLGRCFEVDSSVLLSEALNEIAGRTRPPQERAELIARLSAMSRDQATAEQYGFAVALAKGASSAASKSPDIDLKKEIRLRAQEVEEYANLFTAADSARQTLATTPEDGAAHLAVGTYLAVVRGDWSAALPYLAKSSEATVRTAVQLELQSRGDLLKAAEVAAAWIEAADKSPLASKAVFFEHGRQRFADGIASTKSVATAKMLTRFKKVEAEVLRTIGSGFVKRHPANATFYGGHWYQFVQEPMPWEQARVRCRELGGHLVCIESAAENQWIYQFAETVRGKAGPIDFLIGATEEGHDGIFTWLNGSPFQFSDWDKGCPNPTRTAPGCYIHRHGNGKLVWIDNAPSQAMFICEWDR